MGKNNRRRSNSNRDEIGKGDAVTTAPSDNASPAVSGEEDKSVDTTTTTNDGRRRIRSFYRWCLQEKQGIVWVLGCMLLGCSFGFGVGSGWLSIKEQHGKTTPSGWRINLGGKVRRNLVYKSTVGKIPIARKINPINGEKGPYVSEHEAVQKILRITNGVLNLIPFVVSGSFSWNIIQNSSGGDPFSTNRYGIPSVVVKQMSASELKSNPSHPYVYAVLREAVTREKGGYVHPDLGFMEPAPCGAARGIGMVRNVYHRCQTRCIPGTADEKLKAKKPNELKQRQQQQQQQQQQSNGQQRFLQEEVLLRVPLSYQMTRKVALDTLLPRITSEMHRTTVHELDDAALLVLLLAHERGSGQYSRWLPYIASLPSEPSCGYSQKLRPYLLDTINALRDEAGMDVDGWPGELIRATEYSERIVSSLASDYGSFLQHPKGMSAKTNIRWALCQVASRATAGYQKYGALRMIPIIDMLNHDAHAGGFVELNGEERLEKGDFLDTVNEETDGGAFVVRSQRYGFRKALRMGQELMVNYNVPNYSALDWLVSSGFVPPEHYQNWQKLDAPLPRIRRDGPFARIHS